MSRTTTRPAPTPESASCDHASAPMAADCPHDDWQHAATVTHAGTYDTSAYTVIFCRRCGAGKRLNHADLPAST